MSSSVTTRSYPGKQANSAAFMAMTNVGNAVLGMSLADDCQLTHGSHVNFSGKIYYAEQFGVTEER